MNIKMSADAYRVMDELAQAYARAGHPNFKTWAHPRESYGAALNELVALGLLQPMTPRALRLSERGRDWVMSNQVSDEIRWARSLFSIFQEGYAQQTTGQFFFRNIDSLEASNVGLDLHQTKVALKILRLKKLVSADASGEGHVALTELGEDTCVHPEMLDARLRPRDTNIGTERATSVGDADAPKVATIYNVNGANARFNMNSVDASTNIVNQAPSELFDALRQAIEESVPDPDREELVRVARQLETDVGKKTFSEHYVKFMGLAATHIDVLTPFLPALTQLLTLG